MSNQYYNAVTQMLQFNILLQFPLFCCQYASLADDVVNEKEAATSGNVAAPP